MVDPFSNGPFCFALFWQEQAADHEIYAPITLMSEDGSRFCEPVRVPGVPGAFERAHVVQKIKGKRKTLTGHKTHFMYEEKNLDVWKERMQIAAPPFTDLLPFFTFIGKRLQEIQWCLLEGAI